MTDCSVTLEDVHLRFPVFAGGQQRLLRKPGFLNAVGGRIDASSGKIYVEALKGISFDLRHGEHLGLVGPNGAGKSTLLRVIAGILPPSQGEVRTSGSIGCLFEIGAAVGQDMTGHESIRYQAHLHDVPAERWDDIAADITEFTELGGYLDLPIRTYSAGMRARLMAAMATAWPRSILLIDEGIGAGDAAFQDKFAKRLDGYLESAGLLIMASHNFSLLRKYCSQAMLLDHGKVHHSGALSDVLDLYAKEYQETD